MSNGHKSAEGNARYQITTSPPRALEEIDPFLILLCCILEFLVVSPPAIIADLNVR